MRVLVQRWRIWRTSRRRWARTSTPDGVLPGRSTTAARQRRVALSRMASKMGCKSRVRNGAQHFRGGRLLLDEFVHPILRLRSGAFSLDTLVHAERFLRLDSKGSITA